MSTRTSPTIRAALVRTAALDLAAPIATYYALRAAGLPLLTATLVAAAIPAVNAFATFAQRREVDQVACLTVLVLSGLVIAALLGGGPRLALARDGLLTGLAGLGALATLTTRRSLFFTIARPFGQDPGEDWDHTWEADPAFRRTMITLTVVWGAGLTLDGALKASLAFTLPPDLVPALSGAQYAIVLTALIAFTIRYIRHRTQTSR
jgi:hypothetical protein